MCVKFWKVVRRLSERGRVSMDLQEYKYVLNFKEMVTPIFDLEVYFYQDNESVISYGAMRGLYL